MKHYEPKLCKDCKHYRGIIVLENSVRMICVKFDLRRPIANKEQAETIGELKYGCFEEIPKEELIEAKPGIYGIKLNLKELFKRIFKKQK